MKPTIQINITTRAFRITAVLAVLAVFAFSGAPICKAVTPAPDGGYANGNTAEGTSALFSLGSGSNNTALGFQALYADSSGSSNTAVGWNALRFNGISDGNDNTAIGAQALYKNTSGNGNTAVGRNALLLITTGGQSSAVGFQALQLNSWPGNTAVGYQAAANNTTGNVSAFGREALLSNTTGTGNTAIGEFALNRNTIGAGNTAVGTDVLHINVNGNNNTAVGHDALLSSTGQDNTAIGSGAGSNLTAGDGNVYIAAGGTTSESNTTRIKNIGSTAIVGGTSVVIATLQGDGSGVLGYDASSRRYKQDIEPMGENSETLFALKPVTFRPNDGNSPSRLKLSGLIAEDVEKVSPDLVTYNERGEVMTVRYECVNAMLLNEFLKEHAKVQHLEATVSEQSKGMEVLAAQIKEQNAKIDSVTARLETTRPQPQLAMSNP
jgi:hypothetical protein